ncbi:hypothetical protein EYF80_040885 [Liparis tanakae]|uniref:Uncharacterized protein n=1 Tax=Liparis tanakae TaxID=230148 RepID=A0A4Z2G7K1_9TELE|nr:hypothetical protein EYF80_040885 [Liparis tanakae]
MALRCFDDEQIKANNSVSAARMTSTETRGTGERRNALPTFRCQRAPGEIAPQGAQEEVALGLRGEELGARRPLALRRGGRRLLRRNLGLGAVEVRGDARLETVALKGNKEKAIMKNTRVHLKKHCAATGTQTKTNPQKRKATSLKATPAGLNATRAPPEEKERPSAIQGRRSPSPSPTPERQTGHTGGRQRLGKEAEALEVRLQVPAELHLHRLHPLLYWVHHLSYRPMGA